MNAIVILNILIAAKRSYIRDFKERIITDSFPLGMCFFIDKELSKHSAYDGDYDDIIKFIPEFNPEFCEGDVNETKYWWHKLDYKSRIKAFDKLIFHYENIIKRRNS